MSNARKLEIQTFLQTINVMSGYCLIGKWKNNVSDRFRRKPIRSRL